MARERVGSACFSGGICTAVTTASAFLLPHFTDESKSLAGNSAEQALIFSAIRNGVANGGNSAGKGGLRNNAALPHCGNQIVFAYDSIAVADEVMQQIKNLRLDRNTIFTAQQFLPFGVKRKVFESVDHSGRPATRSQYLALSGLSQVIIRVT